MLKKKPTDFVNPFLCLLFLHCPKTSFMHVQRIQEHEFGDYCSKILVHAGKPAFWFLRYKQIDVRRTSVKRVLQSLKS